MTEGTPGETIGERKRQQLPPRFGCLVLGALFYFSVLGKALRPLGDEMSSVALSDPSAAHYVTYWNLSCPFDQSMWSVSHMINHSHPDAPEAVDDPFDDFNRAHAAREYSESYNSVGIVAQAIKSGFLQGKKIFLDGDSLTKQVFISIGCLAWSSNLVSEYSIVEVDFPERLVEGYKKRLPYFTQRGERGAHFRSANVTLHDGGSVYYQQTGRSQIPAWLESCQRDEPSFLWQKTFLAGKNDFVVLAGTLHIDVRNETQSYLIDFLDCVKTKKMDGLLLGWPRFIYLRTLLQHFPTSDGGWIAPSTHMDWNGTCVPHIKNFSPWREDDLLVAQGRVDYIFPDDNGLDLRRVGHLHVGHRDCTHWIQPGVPDVLAAELVTFASSAAFHTITNAESSNSSSR